MCKANPLWQHAQFLPALSYMTREVGHDCNLVLMLNQATPRVRDGAHALVDAPGLKDLHRVFITSDLLPSGGTYLKIGTLP